MLIRELAYDTETDELDLLIDTLKHELSEVIPIGNDNKKETQIIFGGGGGNRTRVR